MRTPTSLSELRTRSLVSGASRLALAAVVLLVALGLDCRPAMSQGLTATLFFDGAGDPEFPQTSVVGEPAIDSQGNLVFASYRFNSVCGFGFCGIRLHSISPQAQSNWHIPQPPSTVIPIDPFSGDPADKLVVLGSNDEVYARGRTTLAAFDSAGNPLPGWQGGVVVPPGGTGNFSISNPIVDPVDSTVFVRSGVFNSFSGFPVSIVGLNPNASEKLRKDYADGNIGGQGIVQGPARNIYTIIGGIGLVAIDHGSGNQVCSTPATAFGGSLVGGLEGVFSSFRSDVTRYDANCGSSQIFTSIRGDIELRAYDGGRVFAIDYPTDPFDASLVRVLAFTKDGQFLWRNPEIVVPNAFGNPIRAIKDDVLYVLGTDASDQNKEKLFLVDAVTGNIIDSIETSPICSSCGVAVAPDGAIYLSDLNSTKIYKITEDSVPTLPQVTDLAPASGFPGNLVTITGSGFGGIQGASTVSFDSAVASILSWTDTTIEVSVPSIPSGSYGVVVSVSGQASNSVPFTVNRQPAITLGVPGGTGNPSGSFAEPVNTATGNYYTSQTDLIVPGRGLPFIFTRYYNSQDNYTGPLGAGWTHSYNVFLAEDAVTGGVTLKDADGQGVVFSPVGGGAYVPSSTGVYHQLQKNPVGTFTLTRKNQTALHFSSFGKLLSIADRNGNTQALSYDGTGVLVTVTDAGGRVFTFSRDTDGRITTLTDPAGRVFRYFYDAGGNLASYRNPAGGVTEFRYDASHRLTTVIQPNGEFLLENIYDLTGRVIAQTNGRGFTTTFAYNSPGLGQTLITDARGNQVIHTHDNALRLVKITDALAGNTNFSYDANNNRTSVTNQNGHTTIFAYDSRGNIVSLVDPQGNTVAFTYDGKDNLLNATNAKGKTTGFQYDPAGNFVRITNSLGDATQFGYDTLGQLTTKTDARSNTTTYQYDSAGNLVRITDPLGNQTRFAYDVIARLTFIRDPNGSTASATYDALSRLTRITDPLSNQTRFIYDAVGNLLQITDANGRATKYGYDEVNNLTAVIDALGKVTQYQYDENNNRVVLTNAKGNTTAYTYDALNRLMEIADPLGFVTIYEYDAAGNVKTITDATGQANRFSYDVLSRLAGISYADGKSVTYTYDAKGNRTEMSDSTGITTYTYNDLDRLVAVTHPGGKAVGYSYDPVGNRASLTYPDGKTVAYAFDRANRLESAKDWLARNTSYSYDRAGNLTRTQYPNRTNITFTYDPANRLIRVVNFILGVPLLRIDYTLDRVGNRTRKVVDGIPTVYSYDPLYQLTGAKLGPLQTTWAYDAVGNRVRETVLHKTTTYSYDAADRLLSAGNMTFSYDANGNQIQKATPRGSFTYDYDAANRLVGVTGSNVTTAYLYDGDGNRVSQTTSSGAYRYVNDVAATLPVVLDEQGPDGPVSFVYGLDLIEAFSPTFNFFYHYDGLGSVVALTDAAGRPRAAYAYDSWGDLLFSVPNGISAKNNFRFTGEALDTETKLYYLRARYYDSSTGRFLTRDPLTGQLAHPLRLHPYLYGLNNPINRVDPSGLASDDTSTVLGARIQNHAEVKETLIRRIGQGFQSFVCGLGSAVLPWDVCGITEATGEILQTELSHVQRLQAGDYETALLEAVGLVDEGYSPQLAAHCALGSCQAPTITNIAVSKRLERAMTLYKESKLTLQQLRAIE